MMAGEAKVRDEVAIGRLNTSPKTLEEVANLVNTCYRSKRNWTNESMLVSGGSRTTPPRLLRDAQCHEIYVARKGNEIVGCVKTGKVESTVVAKLPYPAGYVGLLAVDAEHQSKGIGTTLVRFAEKRCSDLGLDVIVSLAPYSLPLFIAFD